MKFWKKLGLISLAFLMVFCCSFAIVSCGNTKKDWNKIELNEVTHSIFYAPLYVAINNGYFEDEGLSINLRSAANGSNTSMATLLSGSSDIILAGPETAVYTEREGYSDKPMVFGQLTACDGSFIISKEPNEHFTLDDLKGEEIIGGRKGGVPAMVLEWIIKKELKEDANKVTIGYEDFGAMVGIWESRNITKYCTVFEPTATNLKKAGKAYIMASLGTLSGRIPYTCFIAKQSYLKNHGDVAEKFLRAVKRGYDFITNNIKTNAEAVADALLPSFANTTEELIAAAKAYSDIEAWKDDLILEEADFNTLLDVMDNAGELEDGRPEWSSVVDNSIAMKL